MVVTFRSNIVVGTSEPNRNSMVLRMTAGPIRMRTWWW